jgi:hypothetical protein
MTIDTPVRPSFAAYVPVIVTNANLAACTFDPQVVSLGDGKLPSGKSEFEMVSVIRFRKALSSKIAGDPGRDLAHANLLRQRTVFVVNAAGMKSFLEQFWWW